MAAEEEKTPKIAKARYWWAVLYQENMRPDWRETIDDLLQLPYAYCEHTADKDSKGEHRIWALMRPRKAKTEQRSLDDVMREATEAACASEALSRGRVAPTNSRPRGQSR